MLLSNTILLLVVIGQCMSTVPSPCIDNTWKYAESTGKCYKKINQAKIYDEALNSCKSLEGSYTNLKITLTQLENRDEVDEMIRAIADPTSITLPIWTSAKRISNQVFMYQPRNFSVQFSLVKWLGGAESGDCVRLDLERVNNNSTIKFSPSECLEKSAFICEHYAKPCLDIPGKLDPTTTLLPTLYPGMTRKAVCKKGYRIKEVLNEIKSKESNVDATLTKYDYKCVGTRPSGTDSIDPNSYMVETKYSGFNAPVCEKLSCNITSFLADIGPMASIKSAVDLETDLEIERSDLSKLSYYGTILEVGCPDGFYYTDRSVSKKVYCDVSPNNSSAVVWKGYPGVELPLPKTCTTVKCLSLEADPSPSMNIESKFEIIYANNTVNYREYHPAFTYNFGDTLVYKCIGDLVSIDLSKTQPIICGSKGKWLPKLGPCLKKPIDLNSTGSHLYQSKVTEGSNSNEIGNVILGIIIGFIVLIVILDTMDMKKDLIFLKSNIKILLLRLRILKSKRAKAAGKKVDDQTQGQLDETLSLEEHLIKDEEEEDNEIEQDTIDDDTKIDEEDQIPVKEDEEEQNGEN